MQIVRKSSFVASPWKNGGGITHEVIRVPASGQGFRWRLSVAQIDVSGPFSDFAGYARSMVLLRGSGVRLTFDAASPAMLDQVGDMVEFDGALKTECQLLNGPCTDLNLMVERSRYNVKAWVERIGGRVVLPSRCNGITLVFCITGGLSIDGKAGPSARLDPWDLAVLPVGGGTVEPGPDQGSSSLVCFATLDDNST